MSVLPIPGDDKLNPIVYKVSGTPDTVKMVEYDAEMDGSDRRKLSSNMTTRYDYELVEEENGD